MSIPRQAPFVCGVVGWPLAHSLSPRVHEAGYRALGLPGRFVALPASEGRSALASAAFLGFRALAITIPHKEEAYRFCKGHDAASKRLGVVNTVLFGPSAARGRNSDLPGLTAALRSLGPRALSGAALVLGAGGAARAALAALEDLGLEDIRIAARRPARAGACLKVLRKPRRGRVFSFSRADLQRGLAGATVLVQATPLGMWPHSDRSPIPLKLLRPDLALCETVYNPLQTRLLREAQRLGARTAPGWRMFLEQALIQFQWMTGRRAPRKVMTRELLRALGGKAGGIR